MDGLINQLLTIILISLRISPTFAFAPPFTLLRVPASIRVMLSLSLSAWLALSFPQHLTSANIASPQLPLIALSELFLGVSLALALQWAFAAMLIAGRAIDIQAGFGLALLIDPATRSQTPLIGTLFAYVAGAVFFALGGATDLLMMWAASLEQIPLGAHLMGADLSKALSYISMVLFLAMGLAGIILLTLLLIDMTVAFMSRTLPQMNVLLLGFQVKTLALLITLPVTMSVAGTLFIRLMRLAIASPGRFI